MMIPVTSLMRVLRIVQRVEFEEQNASWKKHLMGLMSKHGQTLLVLCNFFRKYNPVYVHCTAFLDRLLYWPVNRQSFIDSFS